MLLLVYVRQEKYNEKQVSLIDSNRNYSRPFSKSLYNFYFGEAIVSEKWQFFYYQTMVYFFWLESRKVFDNFSKDYT
jgi:hypothetical protein